MNYETFTKAHGHADIWVHVYRNTDLPVRMDAYPAAAIDPDAIQRRLWLLSDIIRVTVEVDCLCQYTISSEHHGISRACATHLVDQVVGHARY